MINNNNGKNDEHVKLVMNVGFFLIKYTLARTRKGRGSVFILLLPRDEQSSVYGRVLCSALRVVLRCYDVLSSFKSNMAK